MVDCYVWRAECEKQESERTHPLIQQQEEASVTTVKTDCCFAASACELVVPLVVSLVGPQVIVSCFPTTLEDNGTSASEPVRDTVYPRGGL